MFDQLTVRSSQLTAPSVLASVWSVSAGPPDPPPPKHLTLPLPVSPGPSGAVLYAGGGSPATLSRLDAGLLESPDAVPADGGGRRGGAAPPQNPGQTQ